MLGKSSSKNSVFKDTSCYAPVFEKGNCVEEVDIWFDANFCGKRGKGFVGDQSPGQLVYFLNKGQFVSSENIRLML